MDGSKSADEKADIPIILDDVTPAMIVAGVCALGAWFDQLPPDLCIRQISELTQDLREPVCRVYAAMIRQKQAHESK